MGVDIKWEGLDKLQDNLEKAATLDDERVRKSL